jgi:hypothetical protein
MYSGEYDASDVTLSVYPHQESLKNMPAHGGNRTYIDIEGTRLSSEISHTRTEAYFSSFPGVDIHSE